LGWDPASGYLVIDSTSPFLIRSASNLLNQKRQTNYRYL
jgi:hypothetical protein